MTFRVEYTKRAVRDLQSLAVDIQRKVVQETITLEANPFPFKNRIKRIQGIRFPCYRLRVDCDADSFRIFFGIEKNSIFILRIVTKKDAEKIIKNLRGKEFPPTIHN